MAPKIASSLLLKLRDQIRAYSAQGVKKSIVYILQNCVCFIGLHGTSDQISCLTVRSALAMSWRARSFSRKQIFISYLSMFDFQHLIPGRTLSRLPIVSTFAGLVKKKASCPPPISILVLQSPGEWRKAERTHRQRLRQSVSRLRSKHLAQCLHSCFQKKILAPHLLDLIKNHRRQQSKS